MPGIVLVQLTHSDAGKPVQLCILWACSHCSGMFITTIQALIMKYTLSKKRTHAWLCLLCIVTWIVSLSLSDSMQHTLQTLLLALAVSPLSPCPQVLLLPLPVSLSVSPPSLRCHCCSWPTTCTLHCASAHWRWWRDCHLVSAPGSSQVWPECPHDTRWGRVVDTPSPPLWRTHLLPQ